MKRIGILTIGSAVILLAALAVASFAASSAPAFGRDERWPAILLNGSAGMYDESIGTGTMPESGSNAPAEGTDETPAVSSGPAESGSAPDASVGTGNMKEDSAPPATEEPGGYDAGSGSDSP
jgi:hypothetical protein